MGIIFKKRNFSLRVLLSLYLIFCQFQPGVASKSIAYKKIVYIMLFMKLNTAICHFIHEVRQALFIHDNSSN